MPEPPDLPEQQPPENPELERRIQEAKQALEDTRKKVDELDAAIKKLRGSER